MDSNSSTTTIRAWQMHNPSEPMVLADRSVDTASLADNDVLVRVAGCGVCHTDLGFLYDGVRTGHALPLTLGHEISGVVESAGSAMTHLVGKKVVVPAVMPCGTCELCSDGHGSICRAQIFPGNDVHGGFASHTVVPGSGLCVVDEDQLASSGLELAELAVIADAVSTSYQAVERAGVVSGDVAVFVGAGGVGGFGAQVARARGAEVICIDVDQARLDALADFGPSLLLNAAEMDAKAIRKAIREHAKSKGLSSLRWKIFECSGNAKGQELAFSLLTFGAVLMVVGYTLDKVNVRFSNLMAFDAIAQGNWGCLPEHFPAVVDLVLGGKVVLKPFIEKRAMSTINDTFSALHKGALQKRPVLIPDFD